MRDFRYAAKALARSPGVTLFLAGFLTLGIGSVTAVFSFFHAVLLRPLHASHPETLVRIEQHLPKVGAISSFPTPYYDAVRQRTTLLGFVFGQAGEFEHYTITAPAPAQDISIRGVTPGFFEALGVRALYGRVLDAEDEKRVSEPAAVLSYRLWRRRLGGDPGALTTKIAVNGRYFTVVGVMPQAFGGTTTDTSPDLWTTLSAYSTLLLPPEDRGSITLEIAGRLKPESTRAQAEAECRSIWQSMMKDYYKSVEHLSDEDASGRVARGVNVESLERGVSILRDNFDGVLKLLIASTTLLLVIVCLNVGSILTARAAARQQEFAVQLALGASPLMLVRQVLAEAFFLAVLGCAGGVLLALAVMPVATQFLPLIRDRSGSLLPLTVSVTLDTPVVLFAVTIAVVALLCFSASPVIAVSRCRLEALLRSGHSTARGRWRDALVMTQVALCTSLLLIASLFVRTLMQLRSIDPGFEVNQIATFTGDLSGRTGADASVFLARLLERVRDISGVESASVSSVAVLRHRGMSWTIAPAGERITQAHFLDASGNTVSADYFDTMRIRVAKGRVFTPADRATTGRGQPIPTVVNAAFATKFFQNADPIAKHFGPPVGGVASAHYEIIGVVNDAKYRSLREQVPPTFYALGTPIDTFVLNVRTSSRPAAVIEPVQKALTSIDPVMPFREVHTMSEEVANSIASERLTATLAASVAACAAVFTGAGIYGALAYAATRRRREIAIRTALGARGARTAAMIGRRTIAMVMAGTIVGIFGASAAAALVRSMLFNVSPQDPLAIAAAVTFVVCVASLATAWPLRRAIRIDPAEVLRQE
jgi:predicted permease